MAMAEKLIVFDCDGTLVDSQHVIVDAMRKAFMALDLTPPDRAEILKTVGLSLPETFAVLAPSMSSALQEELAAEYRGRYVAARRDPRMQEPMFKGLARLLQELRQREDLILGIATGKSRRGVAHFIAKNALDGVFFTLQTADDAPSKPHPAMLLQAMSETGVAAENTVMIGDTTYDMLMARHAGVTGIGVSWGYHCASKLRTAGAAMIANTVTELRSCLITPNQVAENFAPAA